MRSDRYGGFRFSCMAAIITMIAAATSHADTDTGPSYSAASIVNAATQTAEALAPNTIATVYGTNLAFETYSTSATAVGGSLPTSLGGVTVYVNNLTAPLFFVSPGQINFLIPYQFAPGPASVSVARQGFAGPAVSIQLNATSPGMFPLNGLALATHLNGTLVSAAAPANPGEIIVIFAVGLGRTSPDTTSGKIDSFPAPIVALPQFQVLLAGTAVPAANVLYAGLAPGFAGLYQINLVVPADVPANPEIRLSAAGQISPPLIQLAAIQGIMSTPNQGYNGK